ncbi:hypothetical protein CXB51_035374 [Gossypium anomalum]|uniref:Uncharacterized protein n=1 Tax=Gossypium anomalum TaxID=47600 RepID=A0A8J5XMQ6_9ROSI|nr:hypothetical protein CXB51_035374 [Gossypium anomalum]
MQQIVMKLMTQCNEKSFELEIKLVDNRILQEQLQNNCSENEKLQPKVTFLKQQLASLFDDKLSSSAYGIYEEHADKNLVGEIIRLLVQNAKLKKELLAVRIFANQTINGVNHKYSDNTRPWVKDFGHSHDFFGALGDDFELWNFDLDDLMMELQTRKQLEAALEVALDEKEFIKDEHIKN